MYIFTTQRLILTYTLWESNNVYQIYAHGEVKGRARGIEICGGKKRVSTSYLVSLGQFHGRVRHFKRHDRMPEPQMRRREMLGWVIHLCAAPVPPNHPSQGRWKRSWLSKDLKSHFQGKQVKLLSVRTKCFSVLLCLASADFMIVLLKSHTLHEGELTDLEHVLSGYFKRDFLVCVSSIM